MAVLVGGLAPWRGLEARPWKERSLPLPLSKTDVSLVSPADLAEVKGCVTRFCSVFVSAEAADTATPKSIS